MPKIRTTLTIDQDVIERYQRVADLQEESLSSAVSGWLKYSADSAELLALRIAKVLTDQAPIEASRKLLQALKSAEEEYDLALETARAPALQALGPDAREGPAPIPPSCNTGGKVPKRTQGKSTKGPM